VLKLEYILIQICWYCVLLHLCLVPLQIIRWFLSPIILTAIGTVFWAIFYINGMVLSTSIVGYPAAVGTGIFLWVGVILWFCTTLPHFITIFLQFPEYLGISLIYILSALGSLTGFLPGPLSIYPGYILYMPVQWIWQGLTYFLMYSIHPAFLMYAFIWIIPASIALAFFNPFFQCITVTLLIYLLTNTIIKLITCVIFPCLEPIYVIQYCFTAYICIVLRTIIFYIICSICCTFSILPYIILFGSVFIIFISLLFIPSSIIIFCIIVTSPCYFVFTLQSICTIFPILLPLCIFTVIKDLNILILSGGTCCFYAMCIICLILSTSPCWILCCCILLCILLILSYLFPCLIYCLFQCINLMLCCIAITGPCSIPCILCIITFCSICLFSIICCIFCCINAIILLIFICGCLCPFLNCCAIPLSLVLCCYLCLISNLLCPFCCIPCYIITFICVSLICLTFMCCCFGQICCYWICCDILICCLLPCYCICGTIVGSLLSICLCCLSICYSCLATICICLYFPPLMCCMYLFLVETVCFIFYGLRSCIYGLPICLVCSAILSPFIICCQITSTCCLYYPFLCLTQCCMLCVCLPFVELFCCLDCIISNPVELLKILIIYLLFSSRVRFISKRFC